MVQKGKGFCGIEEKIITNLYKLEIMQIKLKRKNIEKKKIKNGWMLHRAYNKQKTKNEDIFFSFFQIFFAVSSSGKYTASSHPVKMNKKEEK